MILSHYIGKTVIRYTCLVLLVFCTVISLIMLLSELRYLGRGDYSLSVMLLVVLLKLPMLIYQLFPMAGFIGCLMGLGLLATHHEITIIRAAGLSLFDLIGMVAKASILLIACAVMVGELIGPPAQQLAEHVKLQALGQGQILREQKNIWLKSNHDFIKASSVTSHQLSQVTIYRFDDDLHLKQLLKAKEASPRQAGQWYLQDVKATRFFDDKTKQQAYSELPIDLDLKIGSLKFLSSQAPAMNLRSLWQYIQFQKQNHVLAQQQQLNFWQRIWSPFSSLVMMLFAIPFVLGPLRSSSTGLRLFMGISLAFSFYFSNQFLSTFSRWVALTPSVITIMPSLLFVLLGLVLLYKRRFS